MKVKSKNFRTRFLVGVLGFTLVEVLMVVVIIALLTAIALPFYRYYISKSANSACLAELKSYLQVSLSLLQDGKSPPVPITNRCYSITTIDSSTRSIVGVAADPGDIQYTIDLTSGGLVSETKK